MPTDERRAVSSKFFDQFIGRPEWDIWCPEAIDSLATLIAEREEEARRNGARHALREAASRALAESDEYERLAEADGGPNICEYEASAGEWLFVAVWLSLGADWYDQGVAALARMGKA